MSYKNFNNKENIFDNINALIDLDNYLNKNFNNRFNNDLIIVFDFIMELKEYKVARGDNRFLNSISEIRGSILSSYKNNLLFKTNEEVENFKEIKLNNFKVTFEINIDEIKRSMKNNEL